MERPAPRRFRRQVSGYPHPSALREAGMIGDAEHGLNQNAGPNGDRARGLVRAGQGARLVR
jgi:hypothetical protein